MIYLHYKRKKKLKCLPMNFDYFNEQQIQHDKTNQYAFQIIRTMN